MKEYETLAWLSNLFRKGEDKRTYFGRWLCMACMACTSAFAGQIGPSGGTVEIAGASITIWPGALAQPEVITLHQQNQLPGAFNPTATAMGATPISQVLQINRTGRADFLKPAIVTVAFDKSKLRPGTVPIVVAWNAAANDYDPVMITRIDRINGAITFVMSHHASYVAVVLDKLFR